MATDNQPEVFDAVINFESQGSAEAISDAAKIQSALDALDKGATVVVDLDVTNASSLSDLEALDSLSPSVSLDIDDTELVAAGRLIDDIDNESPTVAIEAEDSELDDVKDQLEQLRNLAVIDIVLNLPGNIAAIADTLSGLPGVGQVVANDQAEAILSAGAGQENLALAQQLYANNMTESVEAGALFLNQLTSIGVEQGNLEEAANGAINASQAFLTLGKDSDTAQIAAAQQALVLNGLVDSYTEASDVIAGGVLGGLDVRDDLLDTLIEYSSTFRDLGINGEQALAIINSGLEAGFDNSDRVADLFREFNIRASNPDETAAQDSLAALGLGDEAAAYQAGKTTGAEFFSGVIEALQAEEDAGTRKTLASNIFGTQVEDFGLDTVLQIDPVNATFDTIEGRAAEVATLLNDNIGNTFTELFNTINLKAAELLSSDALNLDEKVEQLKEGITTAVDVLQGGGTVGEALEIGLKIEGADTFIANAERIFGNLLIGLLQVVATIQDPLGITDNDSGTRAEIARLSEQQLAFDIQVANPEEIEGLFNQAAERGVTNLGGALRTGLDESFASGNYDQVLNILDAAKGAEGASPEAVQALVDQYVGQLEAAFDASIAEGDFDVAKRIAEAQGSPTDYTDAIKGVFGFDGAAFDSMIADSMAAMSTNIETETATPFEAWIADAEAWATKASELDAATQAVTDAQSAINAATVSNEDVMAAAGEAALLMNDDFVNAFYAAAAAAQDMDADVAEALTGNTVTASLDDAGASAQTNMQLMTQSLNQVAPVVDMLDAEITQFGDDANRGFNIAMVGAAQLRDELGGFRTLLPMFDQLGGKILAILAYQPSLNAMLASVSAGGTVVNNNGGNQTTTVTMTNYNTSGAQQSSSDQQLLNEIRGF